MSLRFPYLRTIACTMLVALWITSPAIAAQRAPIEGVVRDSSGGVLRDAVVQIIAAPQRIVGSARTDALGRFNLAFGEAGSFLVEVRAAGFADLRVAVDLPLPEGRPLELTMGAPVFNEDVSVTAVTDEVEPAGRLTQPVNVIDADAIRERAKAVIVQAASEEAGLQVQRTSTVLAGVFVRGLTGSKVNVFVDGVRYSTAAQRGGVSTFLDLLDPALVDSIEVLRGPNSAQYGSDALGGSLQVLSTVPSIGAGGDRVGGMFSIQANTADNSVGSNASASYAGSRFGVMAGGAARRIGDLRTGGGIDSHAAVTRFLGVRSDRLMPGHLPDTGFVQYGGNIVLNWLPGDQDHVVVSYRHGRQNDGKRYDQLLGGDGNLIADLNDLTLDLLFARYERLGAGWFDQVSVTASVNSQYEERVNQGGNGNPLATITHEPERTTAYGLQGVLRKRFTPRTSMVFGADYYPEHMTAPSTGLNPVTGATSVRRGRVPDGATYKSGGAFAQALVDLIPSRLHLVGNVRVNGAVYRARAADSPLVNGQPLWPDDALTASGVAFRVGLTAPVNEEWTLSANASRGFRAPHITDLGTLGLTGSGFEVAAPDVAGMGGTIGSTADAAAVSTGVPVEQVGPESSLTYEAGIHFRRRTVSSSLAVFDNEIHDNITKQTLILPPGAVGKTLGGTPIVAQNANGAVFVAAATNAVLARTNFDNARVFGVEHTFEWKPAPGWSTGTTFTYLYAKDTRTGLSPNIEGGTPAPDAWIRGDYRRPTGRWWAGTYIHLSAAQDRLSTLDLDDRRTGATRSRSSIRNFFLNGATARGWVSAGPDGIAGSADDVLTLTGETLAQIQNRVLGPGVSSAPLYREVAAFATVGFRGGITVGRHEWTIDFENLTDAGYRGISWGVDGPGRSLSVRYVARF